MSEIDIIVKLRRNADSLNQAGHFAQAVATMREAADVIEALRGKLLWPWPADDGWDVT